MLSPTTHGRLGTEKMAADTGTPSLFPLSAKLTARLGTCEVTGVTVTPYFSVSAGGKKKKKTKGKTLALTDFLAEPATGSNFPKDPPKPASSGGGSSWADATEDFDPSGTGRSCKKTQ